MKKATKEEFSIQIQNVYTFNNWYTHSNFKKFYTQNFVVKFSPHSTLLALGRLHLFQDYHNFDSKLNSKLS